MLIISDDQQLEGHKKLLASASNFEAPKVMGLNTSYCKRLFPPTQTKVEEMNQDSWTFEGHAADSFTKPSVSEREGYFLNEKSSFKRL